MNVELLIPENDVDAPEISIVIPALNEEITIATFVQWCREGIAAAGVPTEILIVDSSTDRTAEIARAGGARVLRVPKRGLGQAYRDALPYVRGKFMILGDADCTYDFREIRYFIEKYKEGYEFVMGSRFAGSIEQGAMPKLHRYFGTPLTTLILNQMFDTQFTDIHCGMRGVTTNAFRRMRLESTSWEYASEMILKAVHLKLRIVEVPVKFYKDRDGRLSHHARSGWLSPWKAGWINLKEMFINGASFFLLKPGMTLALMGAAGLLLLALGPVAVGNVVLSINTMLLFFMTGVIGFQMTQMGLVAKVLQDATLQTAQTWRKRLNYTRACLISFFTFLLGATCLLPLADSYASAEYKFSELIVHQNHLAIFGLFIIIQSMAFFTWTLVMHAVCRTVLREE